MRHKLRFSALFLTAALITAPTTFLPAQANGCVAGDFAAGDGSVGDPFQISNVAQFQAMEAPACLNPGSPAGYYFKLTSDIDLADVSWTPIGTVAEFTGGGFDGDFHRISNLSVSAATAGLFGTLNGVVVKNLTISNATVTATAGDGGVLAHVAKGVTVISQVEILSSRVTATGLAGGLLPFTFSGSAVNISKVAVGVAVVSSSGSAGGIVGESENNSLTISDSYFYGSVQTAGEFFPYAGGILGFGTNAVIVRVISTASSVTGSFVLSGVMHPGSSGVTFSDGYFLDTSVALPLDIKARGTSKTATELKSINTYGAPWTITDDLDVARTASPSQTWLLNSDLVLGYPVLMWQYKLGSLNAPCQPGTYSVDGKLPCVDAEAGRFVSVVGATSAELCPAGYYQPNTGATQCVLAEAGSFVAQAGAVASLACEAGFTSLAGAVSCYLIDTSYRGPVFSSLSKTLVVAGEQLRVSGSNLESVSSVSIAGLTATVEVVAGAILFTIPLGLEAGVYDLRVVSGFGVLVVQDALSVSAGAPVLSSLPQASSKKISDSEVKVYAKNLVGAGKVQYFVNGLEVAWVRAADSTDPKLRSANGAYYLVRTVELVAGQKNVIEIYVDGERVKRAAYAG
jgi:hypothetical protein